MVAPTTPLIPWLYLLILLSILSPLSSFTATLCSFMPDRSADRELLTPQPFQFQTGYFRVNGKYLGLEPNPNPTYPSSSLQFLPIYSWETSSAGILHIKGNLNFLAGDSYLLPGRTSWSWRDHRLSGPGRSYLDGYWSAASGVLCMTGYTTGIQDGGNHTQLRSILQLNITRYPTIHSSLITGTLQSLDSDSETGVDGFDPISILAYNHVEHQYTLISHTNITCNMMKGTIERSLTIATNRSICSLLRLVSRMGFELDNYDSTLLGRSFGFLALNVMDCSDDGMFQMYLTFGNTSTYRKRSFPFIPNATLIGEGFWGRGESVLICMTVCKIMNSTGKFFEGAYVGDCDIGVNLRFPETLTLRNRSRIVGEICNSTDHSTITSFHSLGNREIGLPGVKYRYDTDSGLLASACSSKKIEVRSTKRYPNTVSSSDMGFSVYASSNGSIVHGRFRPLFIGDRYKSGFKMFHSNDLALDAIRNRRVNVSYTIESILSQGGDIAAEGIYDFTTGLLCMVGCRPLDELDRSDCEIIIAVQFPPLNPTTEEEQNLTGSIASTRAVSDPLYFHLVQFSSHVPDVEETLTLINRMDVEMVMVIASLTLACSSIMSQLFHVKCHPDALPAMSILSSSILAVGLMIPLIGLKVVEEVTVRVITMVALVLQLRLLQLVVSARADNIERLVVKWCVPLYMVGGLIGWVVSRESVMVYGVSYAGLVLDGFLIPQVVLNVVRGAKGKALGAWFYGGMSVLWGMPHVYDAYRAKAYVRGLWGSSVYAAHGVDFYSGVWDVVIPCVVVVLVVLVWLQQRFGGRIIVPARWREIGGYETVSEIEL